MNDESPPPSEPVPSERYGENYYANNLGLPYERNDHWLGFFGGIADRIVSDLAPTTSLDVGCAFGFLVEALRDRAVDAKGIDVSEYAVSQAAGSAVGHCSVRSAMLPLTDRYDLITCVEVVEHLAGAEARTALANMAAATDRILLSTTPFDYVEPTHVNVQPPEYWAEIMASLGFFRDLDYDASYLTDWAGLFVRRAPTMRELVTEYERVEWRYRSEVVALRQEVTRHHAMTSAAAVAPESSAALAARLEETLARLAAAEQAVHTARDAAVAAEATAGALRGQLHEARVALGAAQTHQAEWDAMANQITEGSDVVSLRRALQDTTERLAAVEGSTTWRLGWKLLAPYRRLMSRA